MVVLVPCCFILSLVGYAAGNDVYLKLSDVVQYPDADQRCHDKGYSLITPRNRASMEAVTNFMLQERVEEDVWLGLTLGADTDDPADFRWADNAPLAWTKWGENEPNELHKDKCVVIMDTYMWQTRNCRENYQVICQRSATLAPYFERLLNELPTGKALLDGMSYSASGCASLCLRIGTACDVIVINQSGKCLLYYSGNSPMSLSGVNPGWRTYVRRRLLQ